MKVYNELKSITSHRSRLIIALSFFFIIKITCKEVITDGKHKEIIEDLPTIKHFHVYMLHLEKIVDFCMKHKIYVDLNMEFGLFLINVNLKPVLQEKRQSIPTKVRFRLEQLMLKNDVLADYFHYMVEKNKDDKRTERDRTISYLFYNESLWPWQLYTFNTDLLKQTKVYTAEQLEKIYGKWDNYENNVYDYAKYKPNPDESDECIEYLANYNPYDNLGNPSTCNTPPQCKQGLKVGSEFGYGLSHRILFMIVARFSRGCTVFSVKEDKYKVDKYCMRSFNEAQFIAANDYILGDLMLEQMTLCGLYGHAQFFRNSWIMKLLEFQTKEGCFRGTPFGTLSNFKMKEGKNDSWAISNLEAIMGGGCVGHHTAVASGMLASALRYILETYY